MCEKYNDIRIENKREEYPKETQDDFEHILYTRNCFFIDWYVPFSLYVTSYDDHQVNICSVQNKGECIGCLQCIQI